MNSEIKNANLEFFTDIIGRNTGNRYKFYDHMYATLNVNKKSPLSCVSVANNSLSIDFWTGCVYQCVYCHVQGIKEDIADDGEMRKVPIRRSKFSIDEILDELVEHPFFMKHETVLSIGTSSTEPFMTGAVLKSTIELMYNLIGRGLKNPVWIVTKAGIPTEAIGDLIYISNRIEKLIISICWANNPKEIEPVQNNRFKNIDKITAGNISINWYMRPLVKEWFESKETLKHMFQKVSEEYGDYIDCIVPGGLRWTEGIEYGIVEVRGLSLPNIPKLNNIKTLYDEDWETIMTLSNEYFPNIPIYYHSSCAISKALNKSNISLSNILQQKDCEKSKCSKEQRKMCKIKNHLNTDNIQAELDNVNFGVQVVKFSSETGEILTLPLFDKLSPAIQQEITHKIALLNNQDVYGIQEITSSTELRDILLNLKQISNIDCIFFVGSALDNIEAQDIDLLVIMKNESNSSNCLKIVKEKLSSYHPIISDDSIRILNKYKKEINIAVFDSIFFGNKVLNILENKQFYGENRIWCIGDWLPEILLYDLKNAIPFYWVNNSEIKSIFEKVNSYYEEVMKTIFEECKENFQFMIEKSDSYVELDNLPLEILKREIILNLIRYLFLKNKIYNGSIKKIDKLYPHIAKDKIDLILENIVNSNLENIEYVLNELKQYI